MIWRLLEGQDVEPRWLVSACPKHGLHLGALMLEGVAEKMPTSIYNQNHWLGTFQYNGFILEWQPMARWFFVMSRLQQGHYAQGHVGYRADVADFLGKMRVAHVFVYRDPRDAAVSWTHHALHNDNNRFRHPAKAIYHALNSFDAALSAVIAGIGPLPGAVEMFEMYAPWLEHEHTCAVRFEDIICDPADAAARVLEYGVDQVTRDLWEVPFKVEKSLFDERVERMAMLTRQTQLSPTFRRGMPGEWRETFTDEHRRLFKEHDRRGWLVRLGYEENEDW